VAHYCRLSGEIQLFIAPVAVAQTKKRGESSPLKSWISPDSLQ
jgi:hypothetical protein